MRSVWASVAAVWALSAVVAVLAWTRQQPAPIAPASNVVIVRGRNGSLQRVLVPGLTGTSHATTRTSRVAAG